MKNNLLDQLIPFVVKSPTNQILSQLTICFQQVTDDIFENILLNHFESILELEHWTWNVLSKDSRVWADDGQEYVRLFSQLAIFNQKLIFSSTNIHTKQTLLLPVDNEYIDQIFEQINRHDKDTDRFLSIVNIWFYNLALLIHEHNQLRTNSLINYLTQRIISEIIMNEQFSDYINELKISSPSISFKEQFYIKISLFILTEYVSSKPDNYLYNGQQILEYIADDYTNLLLLHSQSRSSWTDELFGCLTHLISLVNVCHQWIGFDDRSLQLFTPSNRTIFVYLDALISIFNQQIVLEHIRIYYENDQTILTINLLELFKYIIQFPNMKQFFRLKKTFADKLRLLSQTKNNQIILLSYYLQYKILSENDFQNLNSTETYFRITFQILQQKSIQIDSLLKDLLEISQYDFIKQIIYDFNLLKYLIELADHYLTVYELLFSLSFNLNIRNELNENQIFRQQCQQISSTNEKLQMIISAIQWNINENHIQSTIQQLNQQNHYDIFLSYSLKDKQFSKQLYIDLIDRQYRVAIDLNPKQFHRQILEAIQHSHFLILCLSENYKQNYFCRLQAQFAHEKQIKIIPILIDEFYRPDGWISILIGNLFSIDFTHSSYSQSIEILLNELKHPHTTVLDSLVIRHQPQSLRNSSISLDFSSKFIDQWTSNDVEQWLKVKNLSSISRIFTEINGEQLIELNKLIKQNSTEENLKYFQEKITFIEIQKLESLIDEQLQQIKQTKKSNPINCCRIVRLQR